MHNMGPKSFLAKRNAGNSALEEGPAPLIVFTAEIAKIAEHFSVFPLGPTWNECGYGGPKAQILPAPANGRGNAYISR